MGRRIIYTLKPEDCYDYALKLEEAISEKQALKVNMRVEPRMVEMEYLPPSSPIVKQRRKTGRKSVTDRPESEIINLSPIPVFDETGSRPMSADEDPAQAFNVVNDLNSNPRLSSSPSNRQFFNVFDGHRARSNTFNGQASFCGIFDLEVLAPESILLHEIAYCVTVPEKPRLFLLTSRGKEGLICRVFLFSTREKAQMLKVCLARRFELAYSEWQSRVMRRASRRRSSLDRQMSQSSASSNTSETFISSRGDDTSSFNGRNNQHSDRAAQIRACTIGCGLEHGSSSEDEDSFVDEEMHREFERRASCLENPERLLVGDDYVQHLNQRFNTVLSRSDTSSGSMPSSDEDNNSN